MLVHSGNSTSVEIRSFTVQGDMLTVADFAISSTPTEFMTSKFEYFYVETIWNRFIKMETISERYKSLKV